MQTAPAESEVVRRQALGCLVLLFRFHGLSIGREALQREFAGAEVVSPADLVRVVRRHGLKAKQVRAQSERLIKMPLPALAIAGNGSFFILARYTEDKILIHRGEEARPELIDQDVFDAVWAGSLILVTRRATLSDLNRQFNISWFLGAIYKYRSVLGQVLLASFFLQVFGLISPLFFQVVVDKVLVHRGVIHCRVNVSP